MTRKASSGAFKVVILSLIVNLLVVSRSDAAPQPNSSGYHMIKTVPMQGDSLWDYLALDTASRRLYISRVTHVVVMNVDTFAVVGDIPDINFVHGVALAPDLGRGFTSNGGADTSTMFDLKTLKILDTIKTGQQPDAIVYNKTSKRIFTMNGGSKDASAINATDGSFVKTIPLGGKPEFAVSDDDGHVYVNIEDKSEIVEIDTQSLAIRHRWPLAPCEEPTGLAIDAKNRRLFSVCQNKIMVITDANSGKVIATAAIGEGSDAAVFDPDTQLAFASNGDSGTLTIIHEDSPNKFSVVENVPTKESARTMAIDLQAHNIFLPAAELQPPPEGQKWPTVKPGSFIMLVIGK